jgi:hypothetical protein
MKLFRCRVLAVVFASAPFSCALAVAPGLHSGIYENLLMAVNVSGAVQGVYGSSNGQGVAETCVIYFTGTANGESTIPLKTWDFETKFLPGTLAPDDPDVDLSIPDSANYGGCGMAPAPNDPQGTPLSLIRATDWLAHEQDQPAKAYLHAAPADGKTPRGYVIKGDIVGLLGTANGWLHVEYIPPADLTKSVKGWIAVSEATLLAPP